VVAAVDVVTCASIATSFLKASIIPTFGLYNQSQNFFCHESMTTNVIKNETKKFFFHYK